MCLDLPDLQDVPLLVRRNEQRPLIRIATLTLNDVAAEVVTRGLDVLEETVVVFAVGGQRGADVARGSLRKLRGYGLLLT